MLFYYFVLAMRHVDFIDFIFLECNVENTKVNFVKQGNSQNHQNDQNGTSCLPCEAMAHYPSIKLSAGRVARQSPSRRSPSPPSTSGNLIRWARMLTMATTAR